MQDQKFHFNIKTLATGKMELAFAGRLDLHSAAKVWQQCIEVQKKLPQMLQINAHGLHYCDGAGIGLLLELQRLQESADLQFQLIGIDPHIEELMQMVKDGAAKVCSVSEFQNKMSYTVGRFAVNVVQNLRENVIFVGAITVQLGHAVLHPKTIRWHDFFKVVEDVGPNALPIIVLIGFLVGLITAFQSAIPLGRFGTQIYVVNLVALGLFREMGPLMTAVLLTSRTASSFAAEIGTMKINQEIDALTTMGLDPIKFLTVPRVLAAVLMTPLLSVFLIFFGLVGCSLVMLHLGYNFDIFKNQLFEAVQFKDFFGGLIKTFVFGIVIAGIGCLHGLKTRMGASAVGYSTTQAVVSGIIMVVIIDGIFAAVYYVLGL